MFGKAESQLMMASEPEMAGDEARLAIAARADREAFVVLYERYVGRVYRYCLVRLDSVPAAQDATSEVFLKALDRLGGYRRGSFAAWLFAIARNVVNDHYRRRRTTVLEAAVDVADTRPDAESHAIDRERALAIRAATGALSKEHRDLLELQLAGWNDSEIAEALGKTRDAVKMLRYRAMKRLRESLSKSGWNPRDWLDD